MYSTLALAQSEAKTTSGLDNAVMIRNLERVTERVRSLATVDLEPVFDTRYFTARGNTVNTARGTLKLEDYLLEPLSIVSDNVALVWGTDVLPEPRTPTPIERLRLNDANGAVWRTWYPQGLPFEESIVINGFWGWRRNYNRRGWLPSNQTILNPGGIGPTDTAITVTNVNANDSLFRTPTFSVGNLLRIDNEMMLIRNTDPLNNILYVERGVNSPQINTEAAHTQGTAIKIFEIEPDIASVVARQAAFFYARRGSYEEVMVSEVARVQYPRDLLAEIYDTLQKIMVIS